MLEEEMISHHTANFDRDPSYFQFRKIIYATLKVYGKLQFAEYFLHVTVPFYTVPPCWRWPLQRTCDDQDNTIR